MIKYLKKVFAVLAGAAVILTAVLTAGCAKSNVVATVNGEPITRQQLSDMVSNMKEYYKSMGVSIDESTDPELMNMVNSMTLEQLITQTILLQEAKKAGIQVTKADVDKELNRYKENMTEEKFKQVLAANGWSEPEFRDMLEKDMIITGLQNKIVADIKPPTEAEIKEYYEKNKGSFVTPASYQVRHILVLAGGGDGDPAKADLEARTKAMAIIEQLKQGKDFAQLAEQQSEDQGTASQGGLYTFSEGEAVPEFEAAAAALKPGEISKEPVKTQYGYHVIKMEKSTPGKQKAFSEVREELAARLTDQAKQGMLNKFIEDAREGAEIVNNLEKQVDKKPLEKE